MIFLFDFVFFLGFLRFWLVFLKVFKDLRFLCFSGDFFGLSYTSGPFGDLDDCLEDS